ncbi:hypothetical protein HK098_007657 [Nowakowskiella sp. JEL0407]|nr:hypothetical protein HK098_007657 [Nowakowskiella sp. JEL0407]
MSNPLPPTPEPQPENPLIHEDPKSRKARVKALFDRMDTEKKGFLTVSSITQRLSDLTRASAEVNEKLNSNKPRFHGGTAAIYAGQLVEVCDKTKDGRITFTEFDEFVKQKEKDLWVLFQQIDSSHDNAIQVTELKSSLKKAGIVVSEEEITAFVAQLDQDRDGVIDFHEFRDFLLLLPSTPTLSNIFKYFTSVYEVDFNSELTPLPIPLPTESWAVRLKYFLAGGVAGAVSRTATAPLDRIRVYLQTQSTPTNSTQSSLRSIIESAKKIYSNGGVLSFWKGNGLNIVKIVPESALKFYVFEHSKTFMAQLQGHNDTDKIGMAARFIAGGAAGLTSQFLIYPLETLKTQVMSQISHNNTAEQQAFAAQKSESLVFRTAKNMWAEGGIRPFFRGCIPSLVGIVPYAGIDLMVFETLKTTYTAFLRSSTKKNEHTPGVGALLVCGMISGSIGASVVYPLSLVRTRLQAQGTPSHPERYTGMMDVIKKTMQREGFSGFFKGLAPSLMKVLPAVSISYAVYETSKEAMHLR